MSLRWDPSKVFPGLAEGIADGSIPFKITLSTAPPPDTTTEVSGTGYTRRPINWVDGTTEITTWAFSDAALPDDEEDWDDA